MNVGNYGISYVRDFGALATEASKEVPKGEPKGAEALTCGSTPMNSIGEVVSAEVENDITRDGDIGDMFNMAFASLPHPELIRN